jgi:hypothetical protein
MTSSAHDGHRQHAATEATRYLCAAAYRDWRFADWVVEEVFGNELRATAASHGIDVVPVVRHCVRARQLRLARNVVLALVVLVGGLVMVSVGTTLTGLLLRLAAPAWATVFAALCLVHYEVVTAGMLRGRFDPATAPRMSPHREGVLRSLATDAMGNVTVYSGFSPFVGCGLDIGGWSLVVDLRRGKENLDGERLQPAPFQVDDLYECATERMRDLRLDRLGIESRLFVNGRDLDGLPWLLPNPSSRPFASADPRVVEHFRHRPSDRVRHYLAVRIVDWQGELILSLFLRFSFTGDNLFCEASYFLLPPVIEKYHAVDDLNSAADLRTVGELLLRSLLYTVPLTVIAPFAVLQRMLAPFGQWQEDRRQRRLARQSPTYDRGAVTTVRERTMSRNYRHYFQKLDREMYVKLVEQQLLDAVITFLDDRNVDTSDLKQRRSTILNNGVIVSGGSIEAQNLAVGAGALARTEQALRAAAQAVPRPTTK